MRESKLHWYEIHYGECPACGREESYRIRVYGRKPKSYKERYFYDYGYCGCQV